MRVAAALALLLHLHPVVGSALCVHDTAVARPECSMPHSEQPPGSPIATASGGVSIGCLGMPYCSATGPVVVRLAEDFRVGLPTRSASLLAALSRIPDEPLGPLFRPPRS